MVRNYTILSAILITGLTACNAPEAPSTGDQSGAKIATLSAEASDPSVTPSEDGQAAAGEADTSHADCSNYAIVGKNWRNRTFTPSQGATYVDDLEITANCKMRRTYCNQEFDIPSNLNPTFAQEQTIQLEVKNVSFDGCFTPGTVTCKIQVGSAYFYEGSVAGQTRQFISLNCAGTRIPSMSYINE